MTILYRCVVCGYRLLEEKDAAFERNWMWFSGRHIRTMTPQSREVTVCKDSHDCARRVRDDVSSPTSWER